MDDYISRQSAIDALNEYFARIEKLKRRGLTKGEKAISLDTVGTIETLPSVQPEIIRCKDCKWYEGDIMANPWGVCCHSGWVGGHSGHEVSEDGWCYRAEKMEVETLMGLPSAERPSGYCMPFEDVAQMMSNLFGECACDVNGNDEWLPQVCKYADTECPQPKEKNGCWMQFLMQGGADMKGGNDAAD